MQVGRTRVAALRGPAVQATATLPPSPHGAAYLGPRSRIVTIAMAAQGQMRTTLMACLKRQEASLEANLISTRACCLCQRPAQVKKPANMSDQSEAQLLSVAQGSFLVQEGCPGALVGMQHQVHPRGLAGYGKGASLGGACSSWGGQLLWVHPRC